jgi:TolB protein
VTDELFEQRLRRDLRRLADELVDGPGHGRPPGRVGAVRNRGPGRRIPWRRTRRLLSPAVGRTLVVIWLLVGVCLVGSGVVAGQVLAHRRGEAPLRHAQQVAAMSSVPGPYAYFSHGSLWTAQPGETPKAVVRAANPGSAPQWSADGNWVAYLGAGDHLHLVHPDGSGAHLALGATVAAMTWSPVTDLLAVVPSSGPDQGDLLLLTVPPSPSDAPGAAAGTGQASSPTMVASSVSSFVWSADGTQIAYSVAGTGAQPDRIVVYDVVTGTSRPLAYAAPAGDGIELAGWWPDGAGVLFWVDPGRSLAAEATGLVLESLALRASSAAVLGRSFVYLPWLAWSPSGDRLLMVEMTGAFPWRGSQLALCEPTSGTCHRLPQPPGTVSIDPTWSPSGHSIAFVRAPVLRASSAGSGLDAWYTQRRLWVSAPTGADAHQVPGALAGAAEPQFGASGKIIDYVTGQAIDSVASSGGVSTPIASGLTGALYTAGPDGYGKLPWGGTAAWGP